MNHSKLFVAITLAVAIWWPLAAGAQTGDSVLDRAEQEVQPPPNQPSGRSRGTHPTDGANDLPVGSVIDSWSLLVGDWRVEGTIGTNTVTGSAALEWAADKHCIVGREVWTIGPDGHTVHLAFLSGLNPDTGEIVEQGFSSSGESAAVRYRHVPAEEGVCKFVGTITGLSPGNKFWKGSVERTQQSEEEFSVTSTIDGQVVHAIRYVRKQPDE